MANLRQLPPSATALRDALLTFLEELGITAGDALQGALATLGPIVTAVVAVALGKGVN